jgi:protein O-GlcNAc transferase
MPTLSEALAIAVAHHQAGRLEQAAAIYRQILGVAPQHAEALHLLGVVAHQRAQSATAVELIGRAVELAPGVGSYWSHLGAALVGDGKPQQAVACCQRAVELAPHDAEAHNNLGTAFQAQAATAEAIDCFQRAIALEPACAPAYANLALALRCVGQCAAAIDCMRRAVQLNPADHVTHNELANVLLQQGRSDEAAACYRRLLELHPDLAEVHSNLATALRAQGKIDAAVASYRRAVELNPRYAEGHNNLGTVLQAQGKYAEAAACYRQALALKPDYALAASNLGNALQAQGDLDAAVAHYRQALTMDPSLADAHHNLANALKDQGQIAAAVAACRRAMELRPEYVPSHNNLVYTSHFAPECDAAMLAAELRRWNQQHAAPLAAAVAPHANDRTRERPLRVGYVSPDFRVHPVGRFLLPLLEAHDRRQFTIYAYASVLKPDLLTERFRALVDVWRDALGLSDAQLADTIRADQIDVLVDLTMHMAGSRLLSFARRPAPVQVSYLAYVSTTGMEAMDYRFTDPYLDPPDTAVPHYAEESVYLPETYWCYRPGVDTPPVNDLPALRSGQVTFGSLNNFCKLSPAALETWSRLLDAVPESRLLLHAHAGSHRDRVRALLAARGIRPERLLFVGLLPAEEYFRVYHRIDVALDPFPYGGGTTTCDALWMGVPVVSLAGPLAVGRGGVSILSNVGLPDLVAHDAEQYVRLGVELVRDLPRLAGLRATLRQRMQQSPLMDASRFARHVEAAYRAMWHRWCATP